MYFHNSDGSLNKGVESYKQPVVQPQQTTPVVTTTQTPKQQNDKHQNDDKPHNEKKKKKKENFLEGYSHLFKRHHNCNCMDCWKNFVLMTIFYAIIIYLLYLLISAFFNKKE